MIHDVGPSGNYLVEEHTVRHFREEFWQPMLLDRQNYHAWKQSGGKSMEQRIKEKIEDILANHNPQPLPKNVQDKIAQIRRRSETERVGS